MKISAKFSKSSIAVAIVMSAVLVGGQFWVRQAQENVFEKRQKLKEGLEEIHQMRANLRGQINQLKDITILNQRNSELRQEQQQFLKTLDQFEKKFGHRIETDQIRVRFKSLRRVSRNTLEVVNQSITESRKDFQEINSIEHEISVYIDIILNDLKQQDGSGRQALNRLKQVDQVVTLAALALIILVLGSQYWLILMPVIHSIEKLQFGASELAKGNLNYRLNFRTGDEIEQLANEFDHMADKLRESYASLLDRSTEITLSNQKLETEITERRLIEADLRASETLLRQQTIELEIAIRDLQQTQSQLIQSEKMSSLGQLVAGIAHEINNPVNFIHGNLNHVEEYVSSLLEVVENCKWWLPDLITEFEKQQDIELEFFCEDLNKILSSMRIGTERIRQIVLSLRNFSRMDESEFKAVDIHEGIDSTLLILQHRLQKRDRISIQVVKDYDELPLIECYAGQLNQVFMNVLANAIDALEERNQSFQPQIKIRTSIVNSDWIEIAISDNGAGIPEQVRSRIFDPFFTTKPVGKGTGMGMSISYQIVTQKHHGKLEYFSTLGEGTEFMIQIPIHQTISSDCPD